MLHRRVIIIVLAFSISLVACQSGESKNAPGNKTLPRIAIAGLGIDSLFIIVTQKRKPYHNEIDFTRLILRRVKRI